MRRHKPKPIYKPRSHDVHSALEHIFYEVEVLLVSAKAAYQYCQETPFTLEPRLLHTRAIVNFLEQKNSSRTDDDVTAEDYGFRPRATGISREYKTRLNKQLAHITYGRTKLQQEGRWNWPMKETLLPLLDPCEEFLQHLLDNYLQEDDINNRERSTDLIRKIRQTRESIITLPEPTHQLYRMPD